MENINGRQAFSVEIQLLIDEALKKSEKFKRELESVASAAEAEGKKIDAVLAGAGGENSKFAESFERLNAISKEAFSKMSSSSQQLSKDIIDLTNSLKRMEQMQAALDKSYNDSEITLDSYISAQARLTVLHEQISDAIRATEQALRSETATMNMGEGSIESMQTQITLLTTAYMKLSQAQREGSEGQAILKNLSEVQTQLQNATVAMNKYAGAAGKQFNGLNFSIQQIARELPSLAMGPQMFFMAISNNLPMFTDELARARKEYVELQATGQKGIPVWKQVVKSLFSWQTALVGGITLLVMHGDKIVSWVSSILKGRDAIISTTEAMKEMSKTMDYEGSGSQIANFERLASLYREIGDNAEEKQKFLEKYRDEIDKTGITVNNIREADNLFIDNADRFVDSVRQRAMALAGMELASKGYAEALKQQQKAENNPERVETLTRYRDMNEAEYEKNRNLYGEGATETAIAKANLDRAQKRLDDFTGETARKAAETWITAANNMFEAADKTIEEANLNIVNKGSSATASGINAINQQQAQITALMNRNAAERIRMQVDLENQVEQARIDAMSDGYEKSEAQRRLDNKKELQALAQQKQEYIDAVVQGEKEVFDAREDARAQQDKNYVKQVFDPTTVKVDTSLFDELESQIRAGQMRSIRDSLNDILKDVETFEQARLRIQNEYAEKRKAMYEADGRTLKAGVAQANIDALNELEKNDIFKAWSDKLVNYTAEALELMLAEAEEQLSILEATEGANPQDILRAKEAVDALGSSLSKLNTTQKSSSKDIKESDSKWTELNEVLSESAEIFDELGNVIPGVAGKIISAIGKIASTSGNLSNSLVALEETKEKISENQKLLDIESAKMLPDPDMIDDLQKGLKGLKTESRAAGISVASATGSIAASVISKITEVINANKEANEAATKAAQEYAEALEQIQFDSRLDKYDTIFGYNELGAFRENVKTLDQIKADVAGTMSGFDNSKELEKLEANLGGGWSGKSRDLADQIKDMADTTVVSDMRSGWQKFWGTGSKNISTFNLADYINEDGTVKLDALQAMYEQYADGMAESERQLVESLIADGERYKEVLDGIKEYVSGLFDDISGTIADSMISAFEETGDAANATFDDIRNNIAKNFAKNAIVDLFSGIFDEEAQSKMSKLVADGDTEGAMDYLDQLIAQTERLAPVVNETLKGLDVKVNPTEEEQEDDRTSTSKGIAQASQDSVDELNGRATAIQGHTFSISQDMKTLVSTSAMMLERLAGIESNTARLESIEDNIARVRSDINDINLRGIKLRA